MKDPLTGRDSMISRTSSDGMVHLNRGLRDMHEATLQSERFRKQSEAMRQQAERMRQQAEQMRQTQAAGQRNNNAAPPHASFATPQPAARSESAATFIGAVSDIRRQTVERGTRTSFRLHFPGGGETLAETMLDFSYGEGELVEIHGEMSTDLILVATSVQPWHPPAVEKSPAPPSDLYYGRAVLSAVLGDILGVIVLATKPSSSARDFLWAIIAISVSAALAALFARTNRKGNAVLGGVFALLVPLCIYLPLRLMHLVR